MSKKNLSLWMDGFMGEANPTDQAKKNASGTAG